MTAARLQKALEDFQEEPPINGPCIVNVVNDTPSSWRVTIDAVAINFGFRDGTDVDVGPEAANIGSGEVKSYTNNNRYACTYVVTVVINVTVEGEEAQQFTQSSGVPEGQCMTETSVILGRNNRETIPSKDDILSTLILSSPQTE